MYNFEIKPILQEKLLKLFKKNKVAYETVMKKIEEIVNSYDIEHYKNLRYDFKAQNVNENHICAPVKYFLHCVNLKRVHIGNFVLVFSFDKQNNFVSFVDFDHHDKIYLH